MRKSNSADRTEDFIGKGMIESYQAEFRREIEEQLPGKGKTFHDMFEDMLWRGFKDGIISCTCMLDYLGLSELHVACMAEDQDWIAKLIEEAEADSYE